MKKFLKVMIALFAIVCVFGVTACSGSGGGGSSSGGSVGSASIPDAIDEDLLGTWINTSKVEPYQKIIFGGEFGDKKAAIGTVSGGNEGYNEWGVASGKLYYYGSLMAVFCVPYSKSGNTITLNFGQVTGSLEYNDADLKSKMDTALATTKAVGNTTYTKKTTTD